METNKENLHDDVGELETGLFRLTSTGWPKANANYHDLTLSNSCNLQVTNGTGMELRSPKNNVIHH